MSISVLIADQERVFADVLAARLEAEDDIDVVGAVQIKVPGALPVTGEPVDVLLLDGDLPGGGANRFCAELASRCESTRVITLSFSAEPERIVAAIRAGTAAWMRKDESLEHLLHVIRAVGQGESWLPSSETGNVLRLLMEASERQRTSERLLAMLTPRERMVLACLAEGTGNREVVAQELHLSVNTVRTHLQNIMTKLGVHSTLETIALTRGRTGWLPGDQDLSLRTPGRRILC